MTSRRMLFISKVRKHRCLWDLEYDYYRNFDMKESSWQSIVDELQWQEMPDVPTAKQEWKKLRDNHRDAIKRSKSNANYKWKYADSMEFLVKFMKTRKGKRLLVTPDSSPTRTPTNFLETSDAESATANNDFHFENIKSELLDEETEGNANLEFRMNTTKDCKCCCEHARQEKQPVHPLDTFYQYLCDATKQFPTVLQNQVKKKMFAVLTEAEDSVDKV